MTSLAEGRDRERELPPDVQLEHVLPVRPCACVRPAADPRDREPTCIYCGRPVRLDGGAGR